MGAVYTSEGMVEQLGVTYRQLDHWVREGYLMPTSLNGVGAVATPGTGRSRIWTGHEYDVAMMFARLVAAGFTPSKIGDIAERLVGTGVVAMPGGITVTYLTDNGAG